MIFAAAAVLIATIAGTGLVLYFLRRHAILDHPNARSSHAVPVPRGGGIAVVTVLVAAWTALAAPDFSTEFLLILAGATGLAAVSWVDDLRSLPAGVRLLAQAAAVLPASIWLAGPVFQGWLPGPLDTAATVLLWLWFVNLFNFMDGIDGISGIEAACVGGGAALIAWLAPGAALDPVFGLTLAAAALGFLAWNRPPAKIFLGDVGSVPVGFLLGWLLLKLAESGLWAPAVILPLYYLADATITLLCRAMRGERVWQAHREHYYQKAVQRGRSHATVSAGVGIANLLLAGLAVFAIHWPWAALAGASAVVAALLIWLSRPGAPAEI
ncbi:MAG: glycosyltransferase family 4 protein [Alphaproteobacteria bacterium]